MHREEFYLAQGKMLELTTESLLVDKFPPADPHNVSSRILRLGLAINSFSSLEAYIKARFEEAASRLSAMLLTYDKMPLELREFLVVKALDGLVTKTNRVKPLASKLSIIEPAIRRIAGFDSALRSYSAFGFSPKGSNVDSSDITAALKAFSVKEPWDKIKTLTGSLGSSQIDLASEYAKLSAYRHRAAHEAASNIPTSDLQMHLRNSIVTGICTDILLTQALNKLMIAASLAEANVDLDLVRVKIRFLDAQANGDYVERASSTGSAVKRSPDLASAMLVAGTRATAKFLVIRDVSKRPIALAPANGLGIL